MKFCMQPPIRPSFALANFQLGHKGQRPKGWKVKRPNFQKLSEAIFTKSKVVHNVFMSIFKLKGPISRNFALELIVHREKRIHVTLVWRNKRNFLLLRQGVVKCRGQITHIS